MKIIYPILVGQNSNLHLIILEELVLLLGIDFLTSHRRLRTESVIVRVSSQLEILVTKVASIPLEKVERWLMRMLITGRLV